ncbi:MULTISPECIES: hypothetical protein [unclassified Bradyrhizobium]
MTITASSKVFVAHMRDVTCADATDVTSNVIPAKTVNVACSKTTDVTSAEATHVTSTKTTDMRSAAEAAAHMASASAKSAATARLRTSRDKAAGEQRSCQNHHHSSFHDILLSKWAWLSATGLSEAGTAGDGHTPTSQQR